MMRLVATVVTVAVAALAAGCDLEEDAGPVRSETRTLERFDRIEVNGRTDMKVRVGGRQSVSLRGGEDLLEELDVTVVDRTLTIDTGDREGAELTVTVSVPELRAIETSGAGEIDVVGVDAKTLELRNDGAGSLEARGRVDELSASLSGVGDMPLDHLVARRARVDVSGVGDVHVNATDELEVRIDGVGDVRYRGNPVVREQIDGAGDLTRAGG